MALVSDESGCAFYFRPDQGVVGDRTGSIDQGSTLRVRPGANAYNSISSVPSAIKTKAATMVTCCPG